MNGAAKTASTQLTTAIMPLFLSIMWGRMHLVKFTGPKTHLWNISMSLHHRNITRNFKRIIKFMATQEFKKTAAKQLPFPYHNSHFLSNFMFCHMSWCWSPTQCIIPWEEWAQELFLICQANEWSFALELWFIDWLKLIFCCSFDFLISFPSCQWPFWHVSHALMCWTHQMVTPEHLLTSFLCIFQHQDIQSSLFPNHSWF